MAHKNTCPWAHPSMPKGEHHLACTCRNTPSVRPLRGRVVIREDKSAQYGRTSIVIPDTVMANERARMTHRGTVIALGPPVQTSRGHEIPHGFAVGDTVQYHFEATEKGRTTRWGDEEGVHVMAQREIDAVIE